MVKCCIKGCQSEKFPGSEVTFHGFPSDKKFKAKWKKITKVTDSVKYKRICPLHFKNEDFVIKGNFIRLRPKVLPTFLTPPFKCESHLNKMLLKSSAKGLLADNKGHEKQHGNSCKNTDCNLGIDHNIHERNDNTSSEMHLGLEGIKEVVGIARCKCCLEGDKLQSMWQENYSLAQSEVYGTMLIECFALPWSRPENPLRCEDMICESCITSLKDAVKFKAKVLASHQLLSVQLETVNIDTFKHEQDSVDINIPTEYLHYETSEDVSDDKDDDDDDDLGGFRHHVKVTRISNDVGVDEFKDDGKEGNNATDTEIMVKLEPYPLVEDKPNALEKGDIHRRREILMTLRKRKQLSDSVKSRNSVSSREKSKKHKLSRKTVTNALKCEDEYSRIRPTKRKIADIENIAENLRNSVEAVKSKKMTVAAAAIAYNVPRELIIKDMKISKVSRRKVEDNTEENSIKNDVLCVDIPEVLEDEKEDFIEEYAKVKKEHSKSNLSQYIESYLEKNINNNKSSETRSSEMKKQANNIAVILEFTNATPIRRHGGIGYGCCFCNEEFPDAADLKDHTIKGHDVKTKRNYAQGKRPSAYLVKLDITGLKCNLCGNSIDSLEQLYDHLIKVHKKLLYRNAKNYIVPFKFYDEELRCIFCEFICNSFKCLLEHMSIHYRNHICDICDAAFLTKNNLFNHAGRHKKGTFKCDYCTKVFDTSSKKAGHQRLVHLNAKGVNRCGYCGESFGTYRRKEKHLINVHGVNLRKLKCKACDKTFETQTGLRTHTKRDHLIERRFRCSVCDKSCFTNVQLEQHMLKHTGIKKFQCTICMKAYGRKSTLREHMRIHENDRRFKCDICGTAFVQKCSWRGHMLSKHGQQV